MSQAARRPSGFSLDAESLSRLLAFVASGSEAAQAEAYRRLREKTESFFRWRGCPDPLGLTDETFDRVARRVAEGAVHTETPAAFVLGVARMVAFEAGRKNAREAQVHDQAAPVEDAPDPDHERRLDALDKCLQTLNEADRELLLRYHRDEGSERIGERARMAEELGVTLTALRLRAFRIRGKVERWVEERLEAK